MKKLLLATAVLGALWSTPGVASSNRAYFVCRITEVVHDTTIHRITNLHFDLQIENNKVLGIKIAHESDEIRWQKYDNIKVSGSPNTSVEWSGVIPDNGIIIEGKLVIGEHNISTYTEQLIGSKRSSEIFPNDWAKGKELEKIYSTCWRQI
jgi:hypothetical protein